MKKIVCVLGIMSSLLTACGKKDSSPSAAGDSTSTSTIKNSVWVFTDASPLLSVIKFDKNGSSARICKFSSPSTTADRFANCKKLDVRIDNDKVYDMTPPPFVAPPLPAPVPVPAEPQADPLFAILDGNVLDVVIDEKVGATQIYTIANNYEIEILNKDILAQGREPFVTSTPVTLPAGSYQDSCPFYNFWDGKFLTVTCISPNQIPGNPFPAYATYTISDVSTCASKSFSGPTKDHNDLTCN